MTQRSTRVTIGAALAAAMLLTAACSSGDDTSDDQLAGIDQDAQDQDNEPDDASDESTEPDADPEDPDAPTFDFPDSFEVVIADDMTGDEETDELLRDHEYALLAMREGYIHQGATDNFFRYFGAPVDSDFLYDFDRFADENWSLSGTDEFYAREVIKLTENQATINFCENTSDGYTVDASTGDNIDSDRDMEFVDYHEYRMGLARHDDGHWQVVSGISERGSEECAQAAE